MTRPHQFDGTTSWRGTGLLPRRGIGTLPRSRIGTTPRKGIGLTLVWSLAGLVLLVATAGAAHLTYSSGTTITVTVDGHTETVRTARPDVAGLLSDLGLRLRPEDRVQPAPETLVPRDRLLTSPRISIAALLRNPGLCAAGRTGSTGTAPPALIVSVQRARPAYIQSDGKVVEVRSHAGTVAGLLTEAGLRLDLRDEVWMDGIQVGPNTALPPADGPGEPATVVRGRSWVGHEPRPVRLSIRRAMPITVDDGSVPYTIYTTASTLGEALLREGLTLYLGDRVEPGLGSRVRAGMRVTIARSTPILVSADGRTVRTRTRGKTVGDALVGLGVVVSGSDRVTPPLDAPLLDNLEIRVARVTEITLVERQVIPYESMMAPDDQLEIDQRRVAQEGEDGEFRRRSKVVTEEGVETSRTLMDEWVAAEPVTRIVGYGRKLVSRPLDTPEGTFTYWRKIRMYATSYSPARSGTPSTAAWYGRTRLGWNLRKGIVAIDPQVIPLQTRLYVPGYGLAVAGDTGGGIRGRWIDLGYEDDDYESWHQWVEVYVLDPPPSPSRIRYVLPNYPPPGFPQQR
jgi:uncharacterized protein YabE (DUF348 family)